MVCGLSADEIFALGCFCLSKSGALAELVNSGALFKQDDEEDLDISSRVGNI